MSTNNWRGQPWTAGQGRWRRRNVWEEHASPGGEKAWLLQREASGAVTKPGAAPVAVSANPPVSWVAQVTDSAFPPECWSHTNLDTSGLWASVRTACTEQFLGSGGRCPLELAVSSIKARTQLRQMLWTGGAQQSVTRSAETHRPCSGLVEA